ncbi:MAG TPA: hypothetical protein VKZ69_10325 [Limnochordales bacterium]|nr:hypothetical protein [Limnochordales bacterium]
MKAAAAQDPPDQTRPSSRGDYARMWWFFFPLALTFSLITFSHTLVNGALARLPSAEASLAGYAVARSIMQLAQNPTLMVRQVVTALVVDEASYRLVRRVIYRLMVVMAGAIAFLGWTPLGAQLLRAVMGLEGEALRHAVLGLRVFAVFPFFSVNRNLGQGLAILARANHLVPLATTMRLLALAGLLAVLVRWQPLPGGAMGALAFTLTMLVEAAVLFWVSRPALQRLRQRRSSPSSLTARQVLDFYVPLMGTTLVTALTIPLVQAGVGRTADAETQLAAFSVAWALAMLIIGPANMLHQTSLAFTRDGTPAAYARTARFALAVGLALSVFTAVIAFSPVGRGLLAWSGATPALMEATRRTLQLFTLMPLARAWREHCWGVLMQRRDTRAITRGKTTNVVVIIAVMLAGLGLGVGETSVLGAVALVIGEAVEGFVLYRRLRGEAKTPTLAH